MTRNTVRRVEVAAPVYDEGLKQRIRDMFNTMQHDNVKARELTADGLYVRQELTGENAASLDLMKKSFTLMSNAL